MEMLLHRRMLVLVAGVALALAVVSVLPRVSSAAPPGDVDVSTTLPGCDFPVGAEVSGKSKVIDLPSGQTLITSPNLRITLTNLTPGSTNQVTYVITGSFLTTEQDEGNLLDVEARGSNLIFGPEVGIFLTIGQFTFTGFEDEGAVVATTPPMGEGSLTDVCAVLA